MQGGLQYGILSYEMFTGDSFGYGSLRLSGEELDFLRKLAAGAKFVWSCLKEECHFYQGMTDKIQYTKYGFNEKSQEIVKTDDKIVDVFYFGHLSSSRQVIIDSLRAAGLRVHAQEVLGHMTRNSFIALAHINLSLPHDAPFSHFSPTRVVYLANNGVCALSPPPHGRCAVEALPSDADGYGRFASIVPGESLIEACFDWKSRNRGRQEGERVFEALRHEPMSANLERALDEALG